MITADTLSQSDIAAIAKVRQDWLKAMNSDNLDGVVAPITDDVIAFPPNEAPSVGRDGQRQWHKARVDQFRTQITIGPVETLGGGEWAFERFSYEIRLTPRAGGQAMVASGPCIWVFRRQADGRWAIARAIWNSDAPQVGPSLESDLIAVLASRKP